MNIAAQVYEVMQKEAEIIFNDNIKNNSESLTLDDVEIFLNNCVQHCDDGYEIPERLAERYIAEFIIQKFKGE